MTEQGDRRPLRPEERVWAWVWITTNACVIVVLGILIPYYRRAAAAWMGQGAGSRNWLFYIVIAAAMGNAIRRIILQWVVIRNGQKANE